MFNPYFIYIATFFIVFLFYPLGWSNLYPSLTLSLVLFLGISFLLSFLLGAYIQKHKWIKYQQVNNNTSIGKITLFIWLLFCVEFIYNKGVPVVLILSNAEYDYSKFGVPTLHVFVITFNSFFAVYVFHVLLSNRSKKIFIYYILNLIPSLLIYSRGSFLMIIVSCIFVYVLSIRRLKFTIIIQLLFISITVLYIFGVLGNYRVSNSVKQPYNELLILEMGNANEKFEKSIVPKEFFWSYLYIASPLATLQHNINKNTAQKFSALDAIGFLNNEFNFDFISKRVNSALGIERKFYLQIAPFLTVATVYARSYSYFSWIGMILMATFILLFAIIYISFLKRTNRFYITALAILNSIYFFLIFDNMFSFTGLSFQLIYPFVLNYFIKTKQKSLAK